MRKTILALVAALLIPGIANGQAAAPNNTAAKRLDRPYSFSYFPPPATCTTAGQIPVFLGSPLALGCDAGLTYSVATLGAPVVSAHTLRAAAPATLTITGSTNATPIEITAAAHGLYTGDNVSISGITGNTNANGFFKITKTGANTFTLQNYSTGADIAGNGAHGGTPVAVAGIVQAQRVLVGDGTAAAPSFGTTSYAGTGLSFPSGYPTLYKDTEAVAAFPASANTSSAATFASRSLTFGAASMHNPGGIAGTLQLGLATSTAAPVAQTLTVQGRTGTDVAGADWLHIGSLGAGSAASGKMIFQVGTPQASGSTRHVAATALTLQDVGTGGTSAPQALFADGTAAKPSIAAATYPGYGFSFASSSVYVVANGISRVGVDNSGRVNFLQDASAIRFRAAADTILTSPATATWQLGAAASATPVAQTLQAQGSRGGTDTDVAGANLTIQPGAGTGNATASTLVFKTPTVTGSGTTQQTQATRLTLGPNAAAIVSADLYPTTTDTYTLGTASRAWSSFYLSRATLGSKSKAIVDATPTAFATIPLADGAATGGEIIYRVVVTSGTDRQVQQGRFAYNAVRKGAAYAVDFQDTAVPGVQTAGTLTVAVTAAAAADLLTFSCNANTDLGAPTLTIYYRLDSTDTLAITPL